MSRRWIEDAPADQQADDPMDGQKSSVLGWALLLSSAVAALAVVAAVVLVRGDAS